MTHLNVWICFRPLTQITIFPFTKAHKNNKIIRRGKPDSINSPQTKTYKLTEFSTPLFKAPWQDDPKRKTRRKKKKLEPSKTPQEATKTRREKPQGKNFQNSSKTPAQAQTRPRSIQPALSTQRDPLKLQEFTKGATRQASKPGIDQGSLFNKNAG